MDCFKVNLKFLNNQISNLSFRVFQDCLRFGIHLSEKFRKIVKIDYIIDSIFERNHIALNTFLNLFIKYTAYNL